MGADLKEEVCEPDRFQASKVPKIWKPKGEEPIKKRRHRQEELDEQKRTNPKTVCRGEESRTSSRAVDKNQMP